MCFLITPPVQILVYVAQLAEKKCHQFRDPKISIVVLPWRKNIGCFWLDDSKSKGKNAVLSPEIPQKK